MKYIKKPVEIEAKQFNGDNLQECIDFLGESNHFVVWNENGWTLFIKTLEGNMKVSLGDYIIKGIKGEYYPCKPDIFLDTYDIVDETKIKDPLEEIGYYDLVKENKKLRRENKKLLKEYNELKDTIIQCVVNDYEIKK